MDPLLRWAVRQGIITEGQAQDADALGDGLATRVMAGELTVQQAGELAAKQGLSDGAAIKRARERKP